MVLKFLRKLPFFHHQPPVSLPLRKAVILSLKRPVQLIKIQDIISKHIAIKGKNSIDDMVIALNYIKKNRMGKNDSGNFLVSCIRSLADWDLELSIEFGLENIKSLPDKRAVNTLVTNLIRLNKNEEAITLLQSVRKDKRLKIKRNQIISMLKKDDSIPKIEDCPYLFDLNEKQKLSKSTVYFNCPILLKRDELVGEINNYSLDLTGNLDIQKGEVATSVIAVFEFFDTKGEKIEFSRINGLTNSKNVGWYSYLRHGEDGSFTVSFDLNIEVSTIRLGFRTWHAQSTVYLKTNVELKRSSYAEISLEFNQFLSNLKLAGCKKLVFIFSGTTFIQPIKANRPIHLANEYLKRGIPVIFSYHRWKRSDPIPEYKGDMLFQLPIDITSKLLPTISEIDMVSEKLFFISYPHQIVTKYLNRFRVNSWRVIYDARDDWEEFNSVGQAKWYHKFNEKYIINNSCLTTAVSEPLAEKLQQWSKMKKVHLSRNALREDFIDKSYKQNTPNQKIIGYFGHLTDSWFDWDSLIKIANLRPDYSFEIIGHSEPESLDLPINISLLGPKDHLEINHIAKNWSVAIIPFKVSKLSSAVDPIKIYEYLALNLPVVSFNMPQIKSYPNTLIANNIDEFCESIDEFIRHKPQQKFAKKWLKNNTWATRVNHYDELIQLLHKDDIFGLVSD
tara:strand:+ start:2836 stop:4857 length:2022 start_codon:yes stop_codon:yes gene_type:complete